MAITLTYGGKFSYHDDTYQRRLKQAGGDGLMSMSLELDVEAKTVVGSGKDALNTFTINGYYDGTHIRFLQRYSKRRWCRYVGELKGNNPDWIHGSWGDNNNEQLGNFVLCTTRSEAAHPDEMTGFWGGNYRYDSWLRSLLPPDPPTVSHITQTAPGTFSGIGKDTWGTYTIKSLPLLSPYPDSKNIAFLKAYDDRPTKWVYTGVLKDGNQVMEGTWGAAPGSWNSTTGTFKFKRYTLGSPEELSACMSTTKVLRGPLKEIDKAERAAFVATMGDRIVSDVEAAGKTMADEVPKEVLKGLMSRTSELGVEDLEEYVRDALDGLFDGFVKVLIPSALEKETAPKIDFFL